MDQAQGEGFITAHHDRRTERATILLETILNYLFKNFDAVKKAPLVCAVCFLLGVVATWTIQSDAELKAQNKAIKMQNEILQRQLKDAINPPNAVEQLRDHTF
jgi:uncharacterized tellurite resistance protein B-like protein